MNKKSSCFICCSIFSTIFLPMQFTHAEVAGNVGKIRVYGALVESACRLEMSSLDQSVDLGNIQTADLKFVGDKAKATEFNIQLEDCISTQTNIKNVTTDTDLWSTDQPGFKVRFLAKSEPSSPNLIAVSGAKGIALQLNEADGVAIDLGMESKPLLVTPQQESFSYQVTPVRVGDLEANAFQSVISFEVIYD